MSTLVIALMAGMAVGTGPGQKVPDEAARKLDLSGRWEGVWQDDQGKVWRAWVADGMLTGESGHLFMELPLKDIVDEGAGKFRVMHKDVVASLGIYRWDGDRVFLCYRWERDDRPTSFRAGEHQEFLILRRVKPRK
jgi:hypothetical protein